MSTQAITSGADVRVAPPASLREPGERPLSWRWQRDHVALWPGDLYDGPERPPYAITHACRPTTASLGYNPFEHALAWGIQVTYKELPDGVRGYTLWSGREVPVIELQVGLDRARERATLAHELLHIERGTFPGWATKWEERMINAIAARRLLIGSCPLPGGCQEWLKRDNLTAEEGDGIAMDAGVPASMVWSLWWVTRPTD